MTMTNTALEAMYAGSALETYLECVEHLPNDVQRYVTELLDLDMKSNELLNEVERLRESYKIEKDAEKKKNIVALIRKFLIKNQEHGDSKLRTVAKIQDMIEVKARQLDLDFENLEPSGAAVNAIREEESLQPHAQAKSVSNADTSLVASSSSSRLSKSEDKFEVPKGKRPRQHRRHQDPVPKDEEKKEEEKPRKKKAKREKANERSPNNKVSVTPDEPVYCLCKQLSYGEMILCDNMQCAIQWFHFDCVNVQQNPKGKWFCPNCRGDRSNVMKQGLVEQIRREKQSRKNAD